MDRLKKFIDTTQADDLGLLALTVFVGCAFILTVCGVFYCAAYGTLFYY